MYRAPEVAQAAEQIIGPKLAATTWEEQNARSCNALKMERIVTIVTIGLIQIVAALNILITLVMMVMEKHRDIAILMSMGARARQIRRIFMFEGVLIGVVGTPSAWRSATRSLSCRPLSLAASSMSRCIRSPTCRSTALDRRLWIAAAAMAGQLARDDVPGAQRDPHRSGGGAAVRVILPPGRRGRCFTPRTGRRDIKI